MSFKDYATSSYLPGRFLIGPVMVYHEYFQDKANASSGCSYVAIRIAHFVTGLFLYPILGAFALVGLAISWMGIPCLKRLNSRAVGLSRQNYISYTTGGMKPTSDGMDGNVGPLGKDISVTYRDENGTEVVQTWKLYWSNREGLALLDIIQQYIDTHFTSRFIPFYPDHFSSIYERPKPNSK